MPEMTAAVVVIRQPTHIAKMRLRVDRADPKYVPIEYMPLAVARSRIEKWYLERRRPRRAARRTPAKVGTRSRGTSTAR